MNAADFTDEDRRVLLSALDELHEPAMMFRLIVRDRPAPQGSKRHVGRGVMVESSKHVAPWREAVRHQASQALRGGGAPFPLDGPLRVRMTFTLHKPLSAPKKRQTWPDRTPDLSKLCRSTEDALIAAGVAADDARFVELDLAKRYPGEGFEALNVPGAVISIWQVAA